MSKIVARFRVKRMLYLMHRLQAAEAEDVLLTEIDGLAELLL